MNRWSPFQRDIRTSPRCLCRLFRRLDIVIACEVYTQHRKIDDRIISKHIRLQQERQEYDYIGPVEEIIDTMRGGTDPHSTIYKKLEDGIAECIKERKQLIPEFTALRESVLSLRSDNVFCK